MNLDDSLACLRNRGVRVTPQRTEILRALINAGRAITAQDVQEQVRAAGLHVSIDTVYRCLTTLAALGLVNQIHLQNRGCSHFEFQGAGHHHHAVCLICRRSFCLDECPLISELPVPTEDPGFVIVGHALEVYGYCAACAPSLAGLHAVPSRNDADRNNPR